MKASVVPFQSTQRNEIKQKVGNLKELNLYVFSDLLTHNVGENANI